MAITKKEYNVKDQIDLTGAAIKVTDERGEIYTIEPTVDMFPEFSTLTPGTKQISFICEDTTVTYEYNVTDWFEDIKITLPKTTYAYKEELNLEGAYVQKVMASGAELEAEPLTIDMIKGFNSDELGKKEITIEYAGKTKNVEIDIVPAVYDMSNITFEDKTVSYNGEVQTLQISGELPQGVSVNYIYMDSEGNQIAAEDLVNAGTYTVVAQFTGDTEHYEAILDKAAKLTINKIAYTLPETVMFNNDAVDYDGEAHTIEVSELPAGITATYVDNVGTNAGEYNAVATFVLSEELKANYKEVSPATMNATLTINKIAYVLPETTVFRHCFS